MLNNIIYKFSCRTNFSIEPGGGGSCKFFSQPPSAQKSGFLKNFSNFSRTVERLWHKKILHTSYPFTLSHMWKLSLHCLQNWQNYTAFSHGNLAVKTLSKIFSTIQDSANIVSVNISLSREKCSEWLSSHFTYSVELFLKKMEQLC